MQRSSAAAQNWTRSASFAVSLPSRCRDITSFSIFSEEGPGPDQLFLTDRNRGGAFCLYSSGRDELPLVMNCPVGKYFDSNWDLIFSAHVFVLTIHCCVSRPTYNPVTSHRYVLDSSFVGNGQVVTGGIDTVLWMYDFAHRGERVRVGGHDGPITSLAHDTTRNVLVTGSADKTVRLFDIRQSVPAMCSSVSGAVLSVNCKGNMFTIATIDNQVHTFDLVSSSSRASLQVSDNTDILRKAVTLDNNGGWAACTGNGNILIGDVDGRHTSCIPRSSSGISDIIVAPEAPLSLFTVNGGRTIGWTECHLSGAVQMCDFPPVDSGAISCTAVHPKGEFFAYTVCDRGSPSNQASIQFVN